MKKLSHQNDGYDRYNYVASSSKKSQNYDRHASVESFSNRPQDFPRYDAGENKPQDYDRYGSREGHERPGPSEYGPFKPSQNH